MLMNIQDSNKKLCSEINMNRSNVMIKKYSIIASNRQLFKIVVQDIFLGGIGSKFISNLKQIQVEREIQN